MKRGWVWCEPCGKVTNGFTKCGYCEQKGERLNEEKGKALIARFEAGRKAMGINRYERPSNGWPTNRHRVGTSLIRLA